MREYTYDELQRMQEKALERVRNMQMHSKEMVEETNRAMESQSPPPRRQPRETAPAPEKHGGRIKMPLNLPENRDITYPTFREYFAPENEKAKKQTEQKTKANLLDSVLEEPDEAVLFSAASAFAVRRRGRSADDGAALYYVLKKDGKRKGFPSF